MMNMSRELTQLGFVPLYVQRKRQTWTQPGQRRVVLVGSKNDVEKLRKVRRRRFHRGMMIYQSESGEN
jgi:hypothetical protein